MEVEVPGEAIVIRFKPVAPEAVLARAEREHRRVGRHAVSVFAAVAQSGELDDDVVRRLLDVSEVAGIVPGNNPQYYICTRAEELTVQGFKFHKDEDDDEVAEHYSVVLGETPTVSDAKRFVTAFGAGIRRPQ